MELQQTMVHNMVKKYELVYEYLSKSPNHGTGFGKNVGHEGRMSFN